MFWTTAMLPGLALVPGNTKTKKLLPLWSSYSGWAVGPYKKALSCQRVMRARMTMTQRGRDGVSELGARLFLKREHLNRNLNDIKELTMQRSGGRTTKQPNSKGNMTCTLQGRQGDHCVSRIHGVVRTEN